MLKLRVVAADDWRLFRDVRLAALRDAPEAFSATIEQWEQKGETHWRARLTDVPFNIIAELDGKPAGMVSTTYPDENNVATLISMWVAPFARGKGVGDALVARVFQWAHELCIARLVLAVREYNGPAIALYLRHGFVDQGAVGNDPPERRMTVDIASTSV